MGTAQRALVGALERLAKTVSDIGTRDPRRAPADFACCGIMIVSKRDAKRTVAAPLAQWCAWQDCDRGAPA
jgi:hypothetical protein